jgi:hypothetical protein
MKFFAEKYYYLVAFTLLLLTLNLLKENLLNRMFGVNELQTVEVSRNTLIYTLYICLVGLFFVSIALLFAKENTVNRVVLIIIPLVIFFFLLFLYIAFGKNNMFLFL